MYDCSEFVLLFGQANNNPACAVLSWALLELHTASHFLSLAPLSGHRPSVPRLFCLVADRACGSSSGHSYQPGTAADAPITGRLCTANVAARLFPRGCRAAPSLSNLCCHRWTGSIAYTTTPHHADRTPSSAGGVNDSRFLLNCGLSRVSNV